MLKSKDNLHEHENANAGKRSMRINNLSTSAQKRIVLALSIGIFALLIAIMAVVVRTYQNRIPPMVDGIVQEQSELELTQTLKSFNDNVLALDRFSIRLNLNSDVRNLMDEETIDPEDPSVLNVQKLLNDLQNDNLWLHSAYIYYDKQNVIVNDHAVLSADQLTAAQKQQLQPTRLGEYRITGTQMIADSEGENSASVISVLRFFPVYSSDCWGAVVLNIRVAALNTQMFSLVQQEGGYAFLVNGNGTIELCSDPKYLKGNLNTLLKEENLDSGTVRFAGDEYRVYTTRPNYFGWRLVQLYPTAAVFARYEVMDRTLRIAYIGITLAGLLVLLGGRLFTRVLSSRQRVQEHMQLMMENQKERFTDSLFYGLLHDHCTMDQTCKEQMALYKVPDGCSAVVELVFEDQFGEDISAALNKVLSQYASGTCLRWKPDAYVLIVYIPESKKETAQGYLTSITEYLLAYIRENHSSRIKAYIGSVEESLAGVRVSLSNAEKAMDDRWLMENDHGIYCYHPRVQPETLVYSEMQAQNVYALIKGGQADAAVTNMQRMINTLCKENQFSPPIVRTGMGRFVTNLVQNMPAGGKQKELDLIREYHSLKCLADIRVWLADLIQNTCQMVQALYSATGSNTSVEQIEQYIKTHLDKDITLSSIAEHFSVSESHFSRMFKQKFGVNFLEYVNRQRIDNAKLLLDAEQRTVNEVARLVGFTNVQTFIRVFKNFEGMTPGVYQNMRKTIIRS